MQYRQGLNILEEFVGNPRALPSFGSATEDIVNISITGSFLPCEDVYVAVLTRRGTRLGPVRLSGAVPPLPDTTTDPHARVHDEDTACRRAYQSAVARTKDITLTANVTLPSSINPDDVVGFELSRSFSRSATTWHRRRTT